MNRDTDLAPRELQPELQALASTVMALANTQQNNTFALLALLRTLERLHREICSGLFQTSLPDNRQDLYALLKDIEEEGGWPYIDRMKLRSLLANLPDDSPPPDSSDSAPQPELK